MKKYAWMLSLVLVLPLARAEANPAKRASRPNVVLITLDGVIADDFYNPQNMPEFWKRYADTSLQWGAPATNPRSLGDMTVINDENISLPGYFSIFAGHKTGCTDNDCDQTTDETFAEKLVYQLGLAKTDVVAIGSWKMIPHAVERSVGTILVNAGFRDAPRETYEHCPQLKKDLDDVARAQNADVPHWEDNRYDRYTWKMANLMLDCHQPRFLYVSLNDTDDQAHEGNRAGYLQALQTYSQWFVQFIDKLQTMSRYRDNTVLLISTDHGRGLLSHSDDWRHHNKHLPSAHHVFLTAIGVGKAQSRLADIRAWAQWQGTMSHAFIAPTVEKLMGLQVLPPVLMTGLNP